jgi:glycosyltransferase involved in cell wall biosynthesis
MEANSRVEDQRSARLLRQRILYALGPGDVVGLYRDLLAGRAPDFQMGMPFSKQFLDWCDESGVEAHVMSWHFRRDSIQVGRYRVENRPKHPWYFGRGLKYYFGEIAYGLTVVAQAVKDRATVVIADSGTSHWIVFSLLAILRIPVIAVLHNMPWPMGFRPKRRITRCLLFLDGWFFRHIAAATVCVSPECERQVRQMAGTPKGPIYQCRAQYREDFLSRVNRPPVRPFLPFRTLFLGRIEEYKGVFLILSIAERLEAMLPGQFAWKIFGAGSAFDALKREAEERKLSHLVAIDGRIPNEEKALEAYAWAHAITVPTTSAFGEGLPMVAIEGILAGRPVVISSVVPAPEVLGPATIVAEVDNVESFVEAFQKLALDTDYYDKCQRATANVQAQFYDRSQGLGNVLGKAISNLT